MAQDALRRRRARPVADAPVDALLARAEQIAKGWLLALLEDVPLHAAPGVLGAAFTTEAPRICDAAVRALASDTELARLVPGGALWPLTSAVGEMTAADDPLGAARAVDALSDVLWAALREELRAPAPDLLTDLSERLRLVCSVVRDAAIAGCGGEGRYAPTPKPSSAPEPEPAPTRVPEPEPAPAPPAEELWAVAATGGPAESEAPLWRRALADEVRDARNDGRPLALLLAELEDADRVIAAAAPARADAAIGDFIAALRGALRRQDILVREAEARVWVIARDSARAAAHSLAARIADAVGQTPSLGGAPLVASVGVAVLGEDGRSAEELLEAAEEARFAASARGIEVSRRAPSPDPRP
jgi:GGDEF domain-containing protein